MLRAEKNSTSITGVTSMKHLVQSAVLALAVACGAAHAQQKGPLDAALEQRKVVKAADGGESLVAADNVRPGDVIEYVATYRNTGRAPVTGVDATVPVPSNTEFLPGTARPANARASLDGRSYAAMPLKRQVVRDGRTVEENIPAREYRYLRWHADAIGGEQSVKFTARVRVLDDVPQAAAKGGGK
jgi:uncharacterized repeat protein (TIGR01451 family)